MRVKGNVPAPPLILIGTGNNGKFSEIAHYARGRSFKFVGAHEHGVGKGRAPEIAETGTSLVENVTIKARGYARWGAIPVITDDTGLFLDRLNGLPGVYTAPWGLRRVVDSLGGGSFSTGSFRCSMAFCEITDCP